MSFTANINKIQQIKKSLYRSSGFLEVKFPDIKTIGTRR
jgi:hypothetical protein